MWHIQTFTIISCCRPGDGWCFEQENSHPRTGLALEPRLPPISNQEAIWLEREQEAQEELRASNFYMIAARPEAKKFTAIRVDEATGTARFNVRMGDQLCEPAALRFSEIPGIKDHVGQFSLETGES